MEKQPITTEQKGIRLRYISVNGFAADALIAEALAPDKMKHTKQRVLDRLGITPNEGEKPLHAWLRVMSEENGLPFTLPAHVDLREAIRFSEALSFLFFLS